MQYASQWRMVSDHQELLAEIRRRLPARVTFDKQAPVGLGHRMETLLNGDVLHLFRNATSTNLALNARLEGASLEEWDTVSGKIGRAPFHAPQAGKIEIALDLPPAGPRLFVVSPKAAAPEVAARRAAGKPQGLRLTDWKVTPASPNVLVLDYCDLRFGGQTYENINTWRANWRIWQTHGVERPAWDNATQFKRRILDHPPFGPDSGFEATFRFRVADAAALSGAQLALENPELYKVSVNGQALDSSGTARWLDPHLESTPVEKLLRVGENTVRVVASPFDVRMELEDI